MLSLVGIALVATLRLAQAAYPPPVKYQNILTSPIDPNVTVAYKQPDDGTCTTAFSTQKQYTGYIGIPPFTLAPIQQNYSINTFFWFVEARQTPETAPLTIWLNGGPGSSSLFGLFNEVGPCEVVQTSDGTYGTQMREFGWDRASNLLFIDQPNQVGLSYDSPTNASLDLFTGRIYEPPTAPEHDLPDFMYLTGTFKTANEKTSGSQPATANTSEIAAAATWHFLQTWLATFPQYNPATRPNATIPDADLEAAGIHLFAESYGGKYAPALASYLEEKNQAIQDGQLPWNDTLAIKLLSVGIVNGWVDTLIQGYYYPYFAYNNTYGLRLIDQTTQLNGLNNFTSQCQPAIEKCRMSSSSLYGDDTVSNELCKAALYTCSNVTSLPFTKEFNIYDIRQNLPTPDPPAAYSEYLNTASVLESIGARVNYSDMNMYIQSGFISTGDGIRGNEIQDLADLLKRGIRVALIYGDADYVCNWLGGQAVAHAIANALPSHPPATGVASTGSDIPPSYADGFAQAGFAEVVVNDSYVGGAVKQYGNLSFSRVYDAGHTMPYYQPETAFQIFARVILGNDLSTGADIDLSTFASNGTANSTYANDVPDAPKATCWVRAWDLTCSKEDTDAMRAGKGLVEHGIYYQDKESISLPKTTVAAGFPGAPISTTSSGKTSSKGSTTTPLTGYYTATGTPSPSGSAIRQAAPVRTGFGMGSVGITLATVTLGMMIMM